MNKTGFSRDIRARPQVAVKKLHLLSERADRKDFLNEVRTLTKIKHRNIVKLFCTSKEVVWL
ncbi:hypothetical protein CsSME_00014323 [Camellia sinensis var. sinensis]